MKHLISAVAIPLSVMGLSCGGNAPAQKESAQQQRLVNSTTAATGGASQGDGKTDHSTAISIPRDARFTVFCGTFTGPGHIQQAKAMRQQLVEKSGMRDWYVVQGQGQTTLYYGFYREVNEQVDPKEGMRAQSDRKRIASMTGSNGGRLFGSALLVALDEADPASPTEWNLENATGHWSLQIAVYKDHPQRKQYAVDAVRAARAQGYEAYYYHGPTASSVCIGQWPEGAVRADDEIRMTNPNEVPLIAPGAVPVKEGIMTPDGKPIRVVKPRIQVLDQSLLATMRAFPNHYVNGASVQPEPSLLVRIPQKQTMIAGPGVTGNPVFADGTGGGTIQPPRTGPDPLRTVLPGKTQHGGKLKSLE